MDVPSLEVFTVDLLVTSKLIWALQALLQFCLTLSAFFLITFSTWMQALNFGESDRDMRSMDADDA